jgi:hypothetical protein
MQPVTAETCARTHPTASTTTSEQTTTTQPSTTIEHSVMNINSELRTQACMHAGTQRGHMQAHIEKLQRVHMCIVSDVCVPQPFRLV